MPDPTPDPTGALLDQLPPVDEAGLRAARRAVDERAIDYRLGTAEAEQVALFSGLKPLLRQFLRDEQLRGARARFVARGLHVAEAAPTFLDPPHAGRVLYVGHDPARVAAAVRADTTTDMEAALGELLGYPRCCVRRFLELRAPRRNVDLLRLARNATSGRCQPRLNVCDLAVFHYLSWTPCAFDCAPSLTYANQVAFQIAFRHGQALERPDAPRAVCPPGCAHQRFVARIDQALGAHRLILVEGAQLSLAGRLDAGGLLVERAWPTARDRHPAVPIDPAARELVARLLVRLAPGSRLAVEGDRLLVDGAPLVRGPELLLVPFGAPGGTPR